MYPEFGGWAWGGATVGATNAWLGGAKGWDIVKGAGIGALSGVAGGAAGQWAAKTLGPALVNGFNVGSPVLSRAINGAIGGMAGGFAGGFTGGYLMSGGNFSAGLKAGWSGLQVGGALGGGFGAANGFRYAKDNNLNPWTGKSLAPKTTSLYRAVSPAEYNDMMNNGLRVNPDGSGYQEGKLFYKSYQDALSNTQAYDAAFGQQSIIIEIQVPSNASVNFNYLHMDGFDVIYIEVTNLPTISNPLIIRPLDR